MTFIIQTLIDLAIMYFLYKYALNEGISRGSQNSDKLLVESFNAGSRLMKSAIIKAINSLGEEHAKPLTDELDKIEIKISIEDLSKLKL
jgi:hypothetical protein